MRNRLQDLINQLESIHRGQPWMGRSFHATWSNLDEEVVFTQPLEGVPAVAQLLDHLTFWRKQALDKIAHGRFEAGDPKPDNWRAVEDLRKLGWAQILSNYETVLTDFLNELDRCDDNLLESTYQDPDFKKELTYAELLQGVLHHDIYHLGQIRLLLSALKIQ